ncbi:MAG: hypothetical protein JKX74_05125 [Flavobacteriales bacterium]|nr:hypothetical protein [Flavobacteriales bacterium]
MKHLMRSTVVFVMLTFWFLGVQAQNVGVNTDGSVPATLLHVKSTAASSSTLRIQHTLGAQEVGLNMFNSTTAGANWKLYIPASSSELRLFNSIDRMTFLSTGEVGINITPSTSRMLQVYKNNNANKYVIHGDAHQTSTTISYQNVGIYGYGQGTNASFGYATGIMGIGGQANSLRAIGVYAGLGGGPATIPSSDAALYSDAASLGYSGIFMNGNLGVGTITPNSQLHVNAASGDGLRVQIGGNTKLIVNSNGGVAVGGNNVPPANGFDVADQIKIRGGSPGVDKVLTSDAAGLATWETPGVANNEIWSLSAKLAYSEDDISGWTTLSGDDIEVDVALGFTITIAGTNYTTVRLSCNGWIEFGGASTAVDNSCLPSGSFANPTLCWFWDDLVTEGSHIRYTTLGTSPNRVFFVDFKVFLFNTSTREIEGTVQIHEGSGLMNVGYKESLTSDCRGQTATIGFQMAGGAGAKVYPIGCNVAVIDDNQAFESGWSICPAR